jgi:hypothetical protein
VGRARQQRFPAAAAQRVQDAAYDAFIQASHVTTWVCVGLMLLAAVIVALRLPKAIHHGGAPATGDAPDSAPAPAAAAPVAGE